MMVKVGGGAAVVGGVWWVELSGKVTMVMVTLLAFLHRIAHRLVLGCCFCSLAVK